MSTDLLPCKHCGHAAAPKIITAEDLMMPTMRAPDSPFSAAGNLAIVCSVHAGGCGAMGGFADTYEGAIQKWNRAATPAPESPAPAPNLREAFVYGMKCARPIESFMGTGSEYYAWIEREWDKSGLAASPAPEVGTGSETSPDAGASIREALESASMMLPACGCQEFDGVYKMCESCFVSDKISAALRLLGRRPAEASDAEQIPHPVAEAEQSSPSQPPEPLDGARLVKALDAAPVFRLGESAAAFVERYKIWYREDRHAALAQAPTRNGKGAQ